MKKWRNLTRLTQLPRMPHLAHLPQGKRRLKERRLTAEDANYAERDRNGEFNRKEPKDRREGKKFAGKRADGAGVLQKAAARQSRNEILSDRRGNRV